MLPMEMIDKMATKIKIEEKADARQGNDAETEDSSFPVLLPDVLWRQLSEADDVVELQRQVSDMLHFRNLHLDLKAAVLVDLFVVCLQACRDEKFSRDQTEAFYSLLRQQCIHIKNRLGLLECLNRQKETLSGLDHLFSEEELKKIVNCFMLIYVIRVMPPMVNGNLVVAISPCAKDFTRMIQWLYQPYKLYEFYFSEDQCPLVMDECLQLHVPEENEPVALREAITKKDYEKLVANSQPSAGPPPEVCESEAEDKTKEPVVNEEEEKKLMEGVKLEDIIDICNEVFDELAPQLQKDISGKLEEKKNELIHRMNISGALRNFIIN